MGIMVSSTLGWLWDFFYGGLQRVFVGVKAKGT